MIYLISCHIFLFCHTALFDRLYEKGNFDAVKDKIIIRLGMQKQRHYQFYMNFMVWVLEIAEHFPMQLCFVTAKVNNPEVVISYKVFKNTIQHSINRNTTIEEVASLIREDINNEQCTMYDMYVQWYEQCTIGPEKNSCPPNVKELKQQMEVY